MGLRATVYSHCTSGSTGSLISTRCYPSSLPENLDLPSVNYAIRYIVVSYNDAYVRTYGNATGRAERRVQIDCYGDTPDRCATLADAVRADWDGWSSGTAVGRVRVANSVELGWQDDVNAYRETVDVLVEHKR